MDIRFGSLTTQSGQQIKFEDFDKDKDGVITEDEYNAALKEYGLDSVELSKVDNNQDKQLSNEEFQMWEQKIKMEEALQPYLTKVTTDFTGKNSKYAADMTAKLRDLIDKFAEEYMESGKNISNLAKDFEADLPSRYETIKQEILNNTPEAVTSRVIDEMLEKQSPKTRRGLFNKGLSDAAQAKFDQKLGKLLEAEANAFIKSYKGDNLEADLEKHLEEYMNGTDAKRLADAVKTYQSAVSGYGSYIDANELTQIKEDAIKLMQDALDKGVKVTIGGYNYTSLSAITNKINSYTDGQQLLDDVQAFIDGLSTKSLVEQLAAEAASEAQAEADAKFASIPGSSYQVDANEINYGGIPGYYENGEWEVKGKRSQEALRDELHNKIKETLDTQIKDQMKSQIYAMLLEQGVPTSKIDQVFENIYNKSLTEVLEGDLISTRNKTWFRKGYAKCNIKEVVDTFIQTFNTNIAKAIDEMNASTTDMDTVDLDMSVLGKGENGEDFTELYATGEVVKGVTRGSYEQKAKAVIDRLRAQLMIKARNMCNANGVEFDASIFTTMFENSKGIAVVAATKDIKFYNVSIGSIDTRQLVDTFLNDFKTNYTAWVNKEKVGK